VTLATVRASLRQAWHLDSALVSPVAGLITALPVVAVFAFGLAVSSPREAISLAVGADLVAIVSLIGAPRLSYPLALADAVGMGMSVFVGTATVGVAWLHYSLLVAWCFAAGLMTLFGLTAGAIGTQAVIAFLLLGRFAGTPGVALHLALVVTAGALVEVGALVVLRLPPSLRIQRLSLASAFEAVATLARDRPERPAIGVLAVVDEAEQMLSAPSLFGRSDVGDLRAVLDQLRRVRLEITTLAGLRVRMTDLRVRDGAAVTNRAIGEVGAVLDEIAVVLRRRVASTWRAAASALRSTVELLESDHQPAGDEGSVLVTQCAAHLRAIDGQLRAAGSLAEIVATRDPAHAWRPRLVRASFTSAGIDELDLTMARRGLRRDAPALRHAVRMAVAVPLSALLALWLGLPRGYWVPFAVAVILQPNYSSLVRLGVGRIVGTALGAFGSAALVTALRPDAAVTTVIVALLAWAAYATWSASFSIATGFITALVLVLLSTSLSNPLTTAFDRLLDVAIGAIIAVVAYRVWPTSARAGVREAESALFGALATYWDLVAGAVEGRAGERLEIMEASRACRVAWGDAEDAVARAIEEPTSTFAQRVQERGTLSVTLRLLRAMHSLRIEAERGATAAPTPELVDLVWATRAALDELASSHSPSSTPALRPLYLAAEARLTADDAAPTIAAHLDELVNSLNTARHLRTEVSA